MNLSPVLANIVLDPAGYCALWTHADRQQWSPRQRSAINDYLVSRYRLPPYDGVAGHGEGVARIVRGWAWLRPAAAYMGAARYARSLPASRCFARLPPAMHAFMGMGFAPSRQAPRHPVVDERQLIGLGAASLAALVPLLPPWLGARIGLPFVDFPPVETDPAPLDLPCFWSALRHASRHPL